MAADLYLREIDVLRFEVGSGSDLHFDAHLSHVPTCCMCIQSCPYLLYVHCVLADACTTEDDVCVIVYSTTCHE